MKLKELINKRKAAMNKIDALLNKADEANRELDDTENQEFENLKKEIEGLDADIQREQNLEEMRETGRDQENHLTSIPGPRHVGDPGNGDLSQREQRDLSNYSFVRAFRAIANRANGQPGELDGLEAEMHQEAVREANARGESLNGIGVPQVVLAHSRRGPSNDLTATGGSGGDQGGVTVATEVRSVIDILHERLMVRTMGATFLTDLVGNVDFPRAVAGTDPAHKAETAASDETSPTFGKLSLSPKRLPVYAEVSLQLLRQSSASVEGWLRNYLATRLQIIMDKMAINGAGSSNQPTGILQTAGIGSVASDVSTKADKPTYEDMIALETEVAVDNADIGSLGYLTTPVQRGVLKGTLEFPDAPGGSPIWKDNMINGYRAAASNVVPSNLTKDTGSITDLSAIIFGNWSDLIVAQWGGLDLQANPFVKDIEGLVRIVAATLYDCGVQHPQSFAAMVDANTVDMA